MMRKLIPNLRRYAPPIPGWLMLAIGLFLLWPSGLALAAPLPQAPDGELYIVQADDWLSKIALKYYADSSAYPTIVAATNAKAAEDETYLLIDDPNAIEVGQKLWIPPSDVSANVAQTSSAESSSPLSTELAGIYIGVFPSAGGPGVLSTLYLNPDGTVRLADALFTTSFNEEALLIEAEGLWQQTSADQVQLTLNAPLAAIDGPTFIRLTAREGELATADDEDHYGQLGRVWLRFDDLALNRNTLPYDSDTATVAVEQGGFTGAYKGALPAAQGHGRDLLLVLNRDRTATLRTDHLNAEPPLLEAGTWTTDSIGRLILTLTGQADQDYDAPIVLQFELLNGVLYAIDEEASRDEARLRLFHMGGLTGGFISQYLSIGP